MAKILLIVAIVVSAATAVLGFMNQGSFKQAKANLEQTEADLRKTQTSLTEASKELGEVKETASALEADKEELASQITAANEAASKAEAAAKTAQGEIDSKNQEIARLNDELEAARNATVGDGEQIVQDSGDSERVAELEAMVAKLEEDLRTSKSELGSLQQKEEARKTKQIQQGLEGQVLAVNPAWNFVVLSIGDRQGVVNNAELLLKRGTQYLGKVRVTSVEPSTSIADIVANSLPVGVSVQPGDTVIFQGSAE